MLTKKFEKVPFKFTCENCDYYTNRKSQYERHLQTKKHNTYTYLQEDLQKGSYICACGKSYKHRQSLNTHKKTCTYKPEEDYTENKKIINELSDVVSIKK